MASSSRWQPSLGAWPSDDGVHFRVWAPDKQSIDVQVEKAGASPVFRPLTKRPDGTFGGILTTVKAGDLYRYRINGKDAYPDPASRYQPQGVHGPSQIMDPTRFDWTDRAWRGVPLKDLVIYELHVGTFTPEGRFDSLTRHLSHLLQLGVTALELMPLGDFAGDRNWGYDGVALYAPARCYGEPDELRHLIDTAHHLGLAVLIDVVYNHFGPDGNYTGVYSPYYVKAQDKTAWGDRLNFDGDHNASVRQFFIENALHWIHEYHADGLRLDATHAIVDESPRHFLAELLSRVRESVQGRDVHVIAEDCRNQISLVQPLREGGEGLSAVWSDDFHHQVRRLTAGDKDGYYIDFTDRIDDLATILARGWLYSGQPSVHFKGPRGTDPDGTPLERFVFFTQNHDQIGNRALGDRLSQTIDGAVYRAIAALLLCLPQTPLLFMGQEWGASSPFLFFSDHHEELGKLVTEGRLKEFSAFTSFDRTRKIPDPQSVDTFLASKLHWEEIEKEPHASLWLFYRALLAWRKKDLDPQQGQEGLKVSLLGPSSLCMERLAKEKKTFWVVVHLKGGARVDLIKVLPASMQDRRWDVFLTSEEKAYAFDPRPPEIQLSGKAPIIEFLRPGTVILAAATHNGPHRSS